MDIEDISLPEGVQIRKQPSPKKSGAAKERCMGSGSANGQGATRQQACTMLEYVRLSAS